MPVPRPPPHDSEAEGPVSLEADPILSIEAPLSVEVQVHTSSTDVNVHTDHRPH